MKTFVTSCSSTWRAPVLSLHHNSAGWIQPHHPNPNVSLVRDTVTSHLHARQEDAMSADDLKRFVPVAVVALAALISNARAASVEAYASVEAGFANTCLFSSVFLPEGHPFSGTFGAPANGNFQDCALSP